METLEKDIMTVATKNAYKYIDEKKEHLHTLNGKPLHGTSTVVGILNKPLTWWAAGMALKALGWTNGSPRSADFVSREEGIKIAGKARKNFFITNEQYYDWLQECYRAHDSTKKEKAIAGTDLHAELEKYVKACIKTGGKPKSLKTKGDWPEGVIIFSEWAQKNIEQFLFSEGHTYSETHWVGGIVDVGAKMKNGKMAVLDFKSSKDAYYSQFVQIGGYVVQIQENGIVDKDGNKVLDPFLAEEIIVVPFGMPKFAPRTTNNVYGFKQAFIGALENYKLSKEFDAR